MKDAVCCGLEREDPRRDALVPAARVARNLGQEPRHTALRLHGFLQPTLQPREVWRRVVGRWVVHLQVARE